MLVVLCEYLTGSVVASNATDRDTVEWPPHPARLYSAFVASWGEAAPERPSAAAEQQALRWLESCGAPEVWVPPAYERSVADHWVPPNDPAIGTSKTLAATALQVVPQRRQRQARRFPSVALADDATSVAFVWPDAVESTDYLAALTVMASRVSYLGHSRSLVRVAVLAETPAWPEEACERWVPDERGAMVLRVATTGRLDELTDLHSSGVRPTVGPVRRYRNAKSAPVVARTEFAASSWVRLRGMSGTAPALEAWPYVAWVLRRALLAGVDAHIADQLSADERSRVLRLLSGHDADGRPSRDPHAAFVPLANVGHGRYSSGALLGAGLLLPDQPDGLLSDAVRAVLAAAAQPRPDAGTPDGRVFVLTLGAFGEWWLDSAESDDRKSLASGRYQQRSRVWSSVTPVVMDRFPKESSDARDIIAASCQRIGLPEPAAVQTHKHSAIEGAPAAWPRDSQPGASGRWITSWRDDVGEEQQRFKGRPLTHVTIEFPEPIDGPVILGAGRYAGLGLLLPVKE